MRLITRFIAVAAFLLVLPTSAHALERICDTAFEDCRKPLIELIDKETTRIDFAFWFLEDARISAAVERAVRERGVKVRVIFDSEELTQDDRVFCVNQLVAAGIPMREKVDAGINHWKLMIFQSQNTVQFSGGNHTAEGFVSEVPYAAYVDEVIYFTDKPNLVNSFKTKIRRRLDLEHRHAGQLRQRHDAWRVPIRPRRSTRSSIFHRSTASAIGPSPRSDNEPQRIDSIIYRITDRAYTDALIENVQRGVGFRLITEPHQYRDESRALARLERRSPLHGWSAESNQWSAGIQVRHRLHAGLTHEKLTVLIGSGVTVFGSSNWTQRLQRLPAGAQPVHHRSGVLCLGARPTSTGSGTTREALRKRSRSCRCRQMPRR